MNNEAVRALRAIETCALAFRMNAQEIARAARVVSEARRENAEHLAAVPRETRDAVARQILDAGQDMNEGIRLMAAATELLHGLWQLISPEYAEEIERLAAQHRSSMN